ncbi:MAG: hypothetical protein P8Z41_08250, partial [Anaerolineales bacterium]
LINANNITDCDVSSFSSNDLNSGQAVELIIDLGDEHYIENLEGPELHVGACLYCDRERHVGHRVDALWGLS